ncbi:hypothetical protein LSCM1_07649 [Leishmania martiniquensis]|uniref:Uncharacterized protein n=1 Tax=Leishmania martiniquensis TaxID=1580590 RepID=A0A836HZ85_9TRYP|nr:hypothetical protein LSCM1_07649 [Leishmania martiniquensis]
MPAGTNVSLMPATASGVLCNSSPIAAAIAVANSEADMLALAGVVRGKRSAESLSSWASELYVDEASLPTSASATLTAEGARQKSFVGAPLLANPTNRSPLASSEQLGTPLSIAALRSQPQHAPQSLLLKSVELSGAIGGSGSVSAPALGDSSAVSLMGPALTAASMASSYRLRKNVSWQCTLCGYHVLAMDQNGTPLPLTTSAFGNLLPMTCPRCKLSHTSWQSSTPFSADGNHMNLPTAFSNRYMMPACGQQPLRTKGDQAAGLVGHFGTAVQTASSLMAGSRLAMRMAPSATRATQQRGISVTAASTVQRRAFYCGRCGRRLLRVDANGELVDMDRDQDGQVLPITCPGCQESHSDWVVKPSAVNR